MAHRVVSGIIALWYGTIASIPSGWLLCDGSNNTPDLRDTFVIAAKEDNGGEAKTNITGSLTKSGGNKDHTHSYYGSGHDHMLTLSNVGAAGSQPRASTTPTGPEWSGGTTDNPNTIPVPYYALAYIMKS